MKKILKVIAVLSAFTLIFTSCGKKKGNDGEGSDSSKTKQEQKLEETERKDKKDKNEDKKGKKESKKGENKKSDGKKSDEGSNAKKNEKSDEGMFLGMTDSNFIVIFSKSESRDINFKIDPSLDFVNSDIEPGQKVNYRYTVSETDEKTITFIEAAK